MEAVVVALVLVFLLLALLLGFSRVDKAENLVRDWAAASGLVLLALERRTFFRGPFFWKSNKNNLVYFIEVQDRDGRRRQGYVRVGSFWLGLLTPESVSVEWI